MRRADRFWSRRHPLLAPLALLGVNLVIFAVFALIAEIALRIYVPYNPSYYMAVGGNDREVEYPYGTIKINRDGFADEEFDLSHSRRVGYFGDSVTYGVGAGHGYRFSDLLRAAYPEYSHMNFGGIGLSVSKETIERSVELADRFELDFAVYFLNMNDIVPDVAVAPVSPGSKTELPWSRRILVWVYGHADWMRGKSYLYTSLRTLAKNYLEARGVGFHGYPAYEFHPTAERSVLLETVRRIDDFHDELERHGVELIVVILPYEMQISDEAEHVYRSDGISWEDGFIGGSTQRTLEEAFASDVRVIDLLPAFVDPDHAERSREENSVGEFFVYDRGDKLDWNHPNRAGHRVIADYLKRIGLLDSAQPIVQAAPLREDRPIE